jgi:NAD(P)-dependent dehydrogenase (short-subunit alcohol dehydrogenase family)
MRVVLSDIDEDALTSAASRLDAETLAVRADVRSWDEMDALASRTFQQFGGVHVLCNNAGVLLGGRTWELARREWEWALGVTWGGVVHGVASFLPAMLSRGEPGHIVNTASIGGLIPFAGRPSYTTAKYAVVGFSEALALDLLEVGAAIGVSMICPGPTGSALHESNDRLSPEGRRVATLPHDVPRLPAPDAARQVVSAILENRFWVLTHPEYNDQIRRRVALMLDRAELGPARVISASSRPRETGK